MASTVNDRASSAATPRDERARKRQAIGLSPYRPTAKAVVERPPEEEGRTRLWLAVVLLVALVGVTAWTVWQSIQAADAATVSASSPSSPGDETFRLHDDFTAPQLPLAHQAVEANWTMGFVGDLYQIRIDRPGTLAWTTLGQMDLGAYRLTVPMRLPGDEETYWGFGGLLARYQNDENFYLFVVDAQGQYQVQLLKEGVWRTIQPWRPAEAVQRAGHQNVLVVEDDGARLRFLVNDRELFVVTGPRLPAGDVGLMAGARSQGKARALFDSVTLAAIPFAQ